MKRIARLAKQTFDGARFDELVVSEASAKRFSRVRDPAMAQLKAYAKAWLALSTVCGDERIQDQTAPKTTRTASPDLSLARTLRARGRGQIVPVVTTDAPEAQPHLRTFPLLLLTVSSYARQVRNLVSFADHLLTASAWVCIIMLLWDPGLCIAIGLWLLKLVPGYLRALIQAVADRLQAELLGVSRPQERTDPLAVWPSPPSSYSMPWQPCTCAHNSSNVSVIYYLPVHNKKDWSMVVISCLSALVGASLMSLRGSTT